MPRPATEPAWAPAEPESGPATVTAARRDPAPSASPGQARPASLPGGAPHRGRRPLMLALLLAGVLAVASAGITVAIGRLDGKSAASPRPGVTGVTRPSGTGQRLRAPTATGSPTPRSGGKAPAAPTDVTATALNQYTIRVTWAGNATDVTGFNVSNGCGTDGCNGGALNVRTGPVTTTDVTTTPGAYQCFYVQAFNSSGASAAAAPSCTSTPGIDIPVTQEWTDTGVTLRSGAALGISATGDVYLAAAGLAAASRRERVLHAGDQLRRAQLPVPRPAAAVLVPDRQDRQRPAVRGRNFHPGPHHHRPTLPGSERRLLLRQRRNLGREDEDRRPVVAITNWGGWPFWR